MNAQEILDKVQALGQWEKLEDLSARFGLPHIPEYELVYFRKLYYSELRAADESLAAAEKPEALAWRGRVRRLLGDLRGAERDLKAALDLEPGLAAAHAWLGELDLRRPEAEDALTRALEAGGEKAPWLLYRGAARLLKRDFRGAREDLQKAAALERGAALPRLLLGLCEEKLGRKPRARTLYAEAAERNPVCSAAYLQRSRAAASQDEARLMMRRAYEVSPVLGFITLQIHQTQDVETPAYVRRIREFAFKHPDRVGAYYRREATQSHFSHFPAEDYTFVEALLEKNDALAWAHAFYGRAACYTKDGVPEGVAHLTRGIALAPHAGWLYAWRANAHAILKKTDEAMADFATSLRLQPYYHRAFVWRAGLLRKLGRPQEALADLDRAIAMDPYYSLTYHERSLIRRTLGDFAGAALDLDRAFLLDHRYSWCFKTGAEPSAEETAKGHAQLTEGLAKNPHVPSLLAWRGRLELQRGRLGEAVADLEAAVQLDPHHFLAHGFYGLTLLRSGLPEEAAKRLRRALALEPRFFVAWGWLAEAEQARGQKAEAAAILARVLKEAPKTPWAHYLAARFAFEQDRHKQAQASLRKALRVDGKYPEAYLLLSQSKLASGDLPGALEAAEKCLEIAPNLGRAYVARAAVRQAAGRHAEALEDFGRAYREFPYLFNEEQKKTLEAALAA